MNFYELREKYPTFIYDRYQIDEIDNFLEITYFFEIPDLVTFNPKIKIKKPNNNFNREILEKIVFDIGMVELVSYFKCTCSPNVRIKAGYLNDYEKSFFKKLYYNGLGEFFYLNKINVKMEELINFKCEGLNKGLPKIDYKCNGNLIAVGGGKDSIVSLEILKGDDNACFIINPKSPTINTSKTAGYLDDDIIIVERVIDRKIVELNNQGFLNGHTPFSAIVAFTSFLGAYLNNKKFIVLSNESSANESTVLGSNINHQYSKSYEFEKDFNDYINKIYDIGITYFSLLRPLSEFQIALLFSKYKKYHKIFRSCNLGSKNNEWSWCQKCPKCLFVYIILSAFLDEDELTDIFGSNLYNDESLLDTFIEVLGYGEHKPFECVGTYKEARYAVSLAINKYKKLPFLLDYYEKHYEKEMDIKFEYEYNNEHNLNEYFEEKLKKELEKYV